MSHIDMAHVVTATVPALPAPPAELFAAAASASATRDAHDALAHDLPAFNGIEVRSAMARDPAAGPMILAAWNAERLKYVLPSADLLRSAGADVLLLSEADVGMARSGNRHTVATLADGLGMGYAYGVEFLELGLGDARERQWHRGERNLVGFHGNAILSRLPMNSFALIRLDDGACWWVDARDDQRRLGYRMAMAAVVETRAGPVLVVCVHLESRSDAALRAAQMVRLLLALDTLYPGMPAVIGGDLNTGATPYDAVRWPDALAVEEPLFASLEAAGFDWRGSNTGHATQRTLPDGKPTPPFRRIDWLLTRGVEPASPRTLDAVDIEGRAISDHDMIAVEISLA